MMTWLRLALSVIRLITLLTERWQRESWMNEGERRLAARQLKEATNALAKAANIEKELNKLSFEDIQKIAEKEGWYID